MVFASWRVDALKPDPAMFISGLDQLLIEAAPGSPVREILARYLKPSSLHLHAFSRIARQLSPIHPLLSDSFRIAGHSPGTGQMEYRHPPNNFWFE